MYDRRGSILRFNTEIGIAVGGYRFLRMNEIGAFTNGHDLEGETMFICGTENPNEDSNLYRAQLLRMDYDGEQPNKVGERHWYKVFGPTRKRFKQGHSFCRGLAFQANTGILGIALEFETSVELGKMDAYVILFDTEGEYLDGLNILQANFVNMNPSISNFGLMSHPDTLSFFFAGTALGYSTVYQSRIDSVSDSFVYKADFENKVSKCVFQKELRKTSQFIKGYTNDLKSNEIDTYMSEQDFIETIGGNYIIPEE